MIRVGPCQGNQTTNCFHEVSLLGTMGIIKIMTGKDIYRYIDQHSIDFVGEIGKETEQKNQMKHFESLYKDAKEFGQKRKRKYQKSSAREKKVKIEEEDGVVVENAVDVKKERKVPGKLEVQNVVGKGTTISRVSHRFIKHALFGKYDDSRFPASTLHLRFVKSHTEDPLKYASVSYANSGEINTAGPKTRMEAVLDQTIIALALAVATGRPFKLENAAPVNFATTMNLGYPIDLKRFEKEFQSQYVIKYHPSKFRGLHMELPFDNIVVVLFPSGAVNIVGIKSEKHVLLIQKEVVPQLMKVAKRYHDEPLSPHSFSSSSSSSSVLTEN